MTLPIHPVLTQAKRPFHWFKHTSRKKKIITIITVIVVFFIILGKIQSANAPSPYKISKVQKGNITEVVSETGNVTTNGRIEVYSPSNGVIEEVFVKNGESVTTGQDLFIVKSSATEQEKSLALANYLASKSTLDTANATLHTLQAQLFQANQAFIKGKGSSSDPKKDDPDYIQENASWLAAEANYKKQQSVINQAQASIASTYLLYQATQNTTVKATADGAISNLSITNGSTVHANMPTAPSTPILSIANFASTEVSVSLSESDIIKINEGQQAVIDINGAGYKEYKGIVRRVDSIGTDEQGVIRYKAYIEITTVNANLRPGMSADVIITTKKIANTLTVPNSAIKPYKDGKAVRIVDPKSKEIVYIPVKIGVKGEKNTQILSGVKKGQEVVTALSNDKVQRAGLFGGS